MGDAEVIIANSVAHIYHSALPFFPATSLFRRQYGHDLESEVNLIVGVNTYWPMLLGFIQGQSGLTVLVEFSPDGRMLCVATTPTSKSDQENSGEAIVSYKI